MGVLVWSVLRGVGEVVGIVGFVVGGLVVGGVVMTLIVRAAGFTECHVVGRCFQLCLKYGDGDRELVVDISGRGRGYVVKVVDVD